MSVISSFCSRMVQSTVAQEFFALQERKDVVGALTSLFRRETAVFALAFASYQTAVRYGVTIRSFRAEKTEDGTSETPATSSKAPQNPEGQAQQPSDLDESLVLESNESSSSSSSSPSSSSSMTTPEEATSKSSRFQKPWDSTTVNKKSVTASVVSVAFAGVALFLACKKF